MSESKPRKYDATLARIAGNIASSLVDSSYMENHEYESSHDEIAEMAVGIASAIVALCTSIRKDIDNE